MLALPIKLRKLGLTVTYYGSIVNTKTNSNIQIKVIASSVVLRQLEQSIDSGIKNLILQTPYLPEK
ncbi:hypothetical protein [Nostoc sp.]|uniref:hypothetical protein n=1 Tax=Nostoc sp. TaxID=1180 RepID=UPI002FF950FD